MNNFDCQDVLAVLSGLLDGELDADMLHLTEVHLNECVRCRDMLEDAEKQDALLQAAIKSFENWPEDLERNIWAMTHGPAQAIMVEQRLRLAAWAGWITAAAACLVAGVLLIFGNQPLINLSGGNNRFTHNNNTVKPSLPEDTTNFPIENNLIENVSKTKNNSSVTDTKNVGNNIFTTRVIPDRKNKQMMHMFITPGRIRLVFINPALRVPGQRQQQQYRDEHDHDSNNLNGLVNPQTRKVARTRNSYLRNAALAYDQFENADDTAYNMPFTNDDMFAMMEKMTIDHVLTAHSYAANRKINNNKQNPSVITFNATPVQNAVYNNDQSLNEPEHMGSVKYGNSEWTLNMEDDFYHASVLLNLLAIADDTSFEDVHVIREVLENEELLDRLADSRALLGPADKYTINQAWTALEWVYGPVDKNNLHRIQNKIRQAELADRIEELSNREWK